MKCGSSEQYNSPPMPVPQHPIVLLANMLLHVAEQLQLTSLGKSGVSSRNQDTMDTSILTSGLEFLLSSLLHVLRIEQNQHVEDSASESQASIRKLFCSPRFCFLLCDVSMEFLLCKSIPTALWLPFPFFFWFHAWGLDVLWDRTVWECVHECVGRGGIVYSKDWCTWRVTCVSLI